jgi:acetoin utilization deacetylase AcuC-like enzyme
MSRTGFGRTGFVCHELYFWHHTGASNGAVPAYGFPIQPDHHPESPDTKRRFLGLLDVSGLLEELVRIRPRRATIEELTSFHTADYVSHVQQLSSGRGGDAGELAPVGTGTFEIAQLSAGGCMTALDAVLRGEIRNAYCLVRPPGHHAERNRGRGYCIFANNVLTAKRAQAVHRLARIAILDWDVHHGNSQESAFLEDPTVLTISVHQDGYYPADSGLLEQNGRGAGAGANINVPLPPGSGHGAYVDTWQRVVVPAVRRFRPDLVIVSSGFDGSVIDPLGRMLCHSETYRALARMTVDLADDLCSGRLVVVHEGGYSPAYVPFCGLAVVEELVGHRTVVEDPLLSVFENMPGQPTQAHQRAVIDQAAALVERVNGPV